MGDLIPGLPEEVARECLVRVGFDQLPVVRRISRQWKWEVESPYYSRLRRAEGLARPMLALVQAQPTAPADGAGPVQKSSAAGAGAGGPANSYRAVLLDPVEGRWAPLPTLPGPTESLPLFCQIAAVDGGQGRKRLVVVGGWHPETWAPMNTVYVYNFLTGAWKRGAPMPGPRRSFFACAAVGGTVYVAGGHDEEKNALRSALAYDPEADTWAELPDMSAERDEPRGLCVGGGKFLVVGGYPTEAQGRFVGSAEVFDPAVSAWEPVQEGVLPESASPRTCCVVPGTERVYMLHDGFLVARDGASPWRTVAQVPEDARTAATVSALPDGSVVVIGSGCHGGDQTVYVLREEVGKGGAASWARAPAPPEFSGHVLASSFLEI